VGRKKKKKQGVELPKGRSAGRTEDDCLMNGKEQKGKAFFGRIKGGGKEKTLRRKSRLNFQMIGV